MNEWNKLVQHVTTVTPRSFSYREKNNYTAPYWILRSERNCQTAPCSERTRYLCGCLEWRQEQGMAETWLVHTQWPLLHLLWEETARSEKNNKRRNCLKLFKVKTDSFQSEEHGLSELQPRFDSPQVPTVHSHATIMFDLSRSLWRGG